VKARAPARELNLAGVDHEALVFGGQSGVDPAGLAGHEQRLP
jgi:hypothetical protein